MLVVLSLATFRLTRLVVRDDFPPIAWAREKIQRARPPVAQRSMVVRWDGNGSFNLEFYDEQSSEHWRFWWLGELLSCYWCASAYVAGALTALATLTVSVPTPWLMWLATWGAGAVLADRLS